MGTQLALSLAMALLTVAVHAIGLAVLLKAIKHEDTTEKMHHVSALSLRALTFTMLVLVALFVLHGIEIWLFALLYYAIGALPDMSEAVYYSTISYSTVGYDDGRIPEQWRLLGAIESINGVILLGWSTAFLFEMVSHIERSRTPDD